MSAKKRAARRADRTYGDEQLQTLQRNTFRYFWEETNPENGLIPDNTSADDVPASIAVWDLLLPAIPSRSSARLCPAPRRLNARWPRCASSGTRRKVRRRTRPVIEVSFTISSMSRLVRRAWRCELSTIDTTILVAGALTAAAYFDQETDDEREVRKLGDSLYRRVDWRWAQNGKATVSHGWKPETGFLRAHWQGYNEALMLYVLGLGSPTHPLPEKSYPAWTSTYRWKKLYGHEFLHGAPLFMHQLSHLWLDFRGIQDAFMRRQAIDYFENSRRATYVNQQYTIRNPKGFRDYGQHAWGITASNGPGPRRGE